MQNKNDTYQHQRCTQRWLSKGLAPNGHIGTQQEDPWNTFGWILDIGAQRQNMVSNDTNSVSSITLVSPMEHKPVQRELSQRLNVKAAPGSAILRRTP